MIAVGVHPCFGCVPCHEHDLEVLRGSAGTLALATTRFAENGRVGVDAILRGIRSVQSVGTDARVRDIAAGKALPAHEASQSALAGWFPFAASLVRTVRNAIDGQNDVHRNCILFLDRRRSFVRRTVLDQSGVVPRGIDTGARTCRVSRAPLGSRVTWTGCKSWCGDCVCAQVRVRGFHVLGAATLASWVSAPRAGDETASRD